MSAKRGLFATSRCTVPASWLQLHSCAGCCAVQLLCCPAVAMVSYTQYALIAMLVATLQGRRHRHPSVRRRCPVGSACCGCGKLEAARAASAAAASCMLAHPREALLRCVHNCKHHLEMGA